MDRQHHVPVSIEAKTRSELSAEMLLNNLKFSVFFKYFDIQKDGKRWVAWYYADFRNQLDENKQQIKLKQRNNDGTR